MISNTAKSYGDTTNTVKSEDPAVGLIPSYQLLDWSSALHLGKYNIKFGVNNLAEKRYFTVRTKEYPVLELFLLSGEVSIRDLMQGFK